MQIVTLITDWQYSDYYVAVLKARLLGISSALTILDISHNVQPFNTLQAAFLLRHTYRCFSKGTIHLIGVNSEPSQSNKLALVEADGHFFVAPNDGTLSLALDNTTVTATELPLPTNVADGFKAIHSFARAVQAITTKTIDTAGSRTKLTPSLVNRPTYDAKMISGQVAYIDSFGNIITNIDKQLFHTLQRGRHFEIYVQSHHNKLTNLSHFYDDVASSEMLALFNSLHLLEIAVNQGNVAQLEQLDSTSSVIVKFIE